MSRWQDLDYVLQQISEKMHDNNLPQEQRLWFSNLYDRLQNHETSVDDAIWEAKQIGVRNPAFPDDLVGWLDDDFDYPDDEEDEEDEQ